MWPIVLAGGAGCGAVVVLALFYRIWPLDAAIALVVVALATGFGIVRSAAGGELGAGRIAPLSVEQADAPAYADLVDVLPDPIMVISAREADDITDRRVVFANAAARTLLKIGEGERRLVRVIRDPEVLEVADEALFGGLDAETVFEMGGAQVRMLRAHARPLRGGADDPRLAVLVLRDETEARRVEQTRADFLANASHELRTPLASLVGFIETLRGHAREDAGARDRFLGIMQAQAERMSRLIDDLMSLSRIELNEHVAPSDLVDLAAAVGDVLDAAGPLARERAVGFQLALPEKGAAMVVGDRDQIVQVVQNLVDNAMKYSPLGANVRIEVIAGLSADAAATGRRPDAPRLSLLTPDHTGDVYAMLRVSDEGPGMARENLPRLSERFYRVEGQKSGERSGTGLGLAIVKHIVNRHRGGLSVESMVGDGATFSAYFPMAVAGRDGEVGDRRETVINL